MLGIIDWGIGGVSIYKLLKVRKPDISILYFSDTGATPYGRMERRELADRMDRVIEFLRGEGMTRLVIGCNAASTAIPDLSDHGIKIDGVVEPAIELTAKLKPKKLGVIGGRRTVISGVYRRGFSAYGIAVSQRIAQPLSGMIESGDTSSGRLHAEAKKILSPLKNCSHILLACTHYPAIQGQLKQFVSPSTIFVDPAAAVVNKVGDFANSTKGVDRFFTTGDAKQMKRSAKLAFDVDIEKVEVVRL